MIYVDNAKNPLRRMLMSHLLADSVDELHTFAKLLGLRREWFQGDHYDVCQTVRNLAVQLGASEITQRQAVAQRRALRRRQRKNPW